MPRRPLWSREIDEAVASKETRTLAAGGFGDDLNDGEWWEFEWSHKSEKSENETNMSLIMSMPLMLMLQFHSKLRNWAPRTQIRTIAVIHPGYIPRPICVSTQRPGGSNMLSLQTSLFGEVYPCLATKKYLKESCSSPQKMWWNTVVETCLNIVLATF